MKNPSVKIRLFKFLARPFDRHLAQVAERTLYQEVYWPTEGLPHTDSFAPDGAVLTIEEEFVLNQSSYVRRFEPPSGFLAHLPKPEVRINATKPFWQTRLDWVFFWWVHVVNLPAVSVPDQAENQK